MAQKIKLNELAEYLEAFDYPIDRATAAEHSQNTTLVLADGEQDLNELLEQSNADEFDSENDLETEVFNLLPRNAVGEPYQSEGEG